MASTTKISTHFWAEEETRFMLSQVEELNILKFMDGRKTRNAYLFKEVSVRMVDAGFCRTPEQIRIKWKNIRKAYNSAKQSGSRRERLNCPFYSRLDDLLGRRAASQASAAEQAPDVGLDVGFEAAEHEIKIETGEETSTEMGGHEDDSPGSTEGTRRLSPRPRSPELPGTSVLQPDPGLRRRRQQQHAGGLDLMGQHMAEMREFWREQLKESDAWQERLLTTIMDNNSAMVAALLEGIKGLRPQAPPPTPPPPPPPPPCVCQVAVKHEEESYEPVDGL